MSCRHGAYRLERVQLRSDMMGLTASLMINCSVTTDCVNPILMHIWSLIFDARPLILIMIISVSGLYICHPFKAVFSKTFQSPETLRPNEEMRPYRTFFLPHQILYTNDVSIDQHYVRLIVLCQTISCGTFSV